MCVSCSVVSYSLQSHRLYSTRLLYPWDSPGKNTGVDCLLQRIFPTQGLNPGLLHCRQILYQLRYWWNGFLFGLPLSFISLYFLWMGPCSDFTQGILKFARNVTPYQNNCLWKCKSDLELGEWLSLIWCWRPWAISGSYLLGCSEIKLQVYSIWCFPDS